jgi:hypothetical protein
MLVKYEYPLAQTKVYPASPGASPNMTAREKAERDGALHENIAMENSGKEENRFQPLK